MIEELKTVVSPPSDPIELGSDAMIPGVERLMGIALPADIYDYGKSYGTGRFSKRQFCIFNPFASNYKNRVEEICSTLAAYSKDEGDLFGDIVFYPKTGGLLPWGYEDNGNIMFFLMEGFPNQWPTLFYERNYDKFYRHDLSATTIIARVLSKKMKFDFLSDQANARLTANFESLNY